MTEISANNAEELEILLKKQVKLTSLPDAILIIVEPLGVSPDSFLVMGKFAAKYRIPLGGAFMSVEGYESIFGLIPQAVPQGRQAAILAEKILKGTRAGTIPVLSAENFLQVNYKAAKKLGLTVPEGLLSRADKIIR